MSIQSGNICGWYYNTIKGETIWCKTDSANM
jgi:hypothetical protein